MGPRVREDDRGHGARPAMVTNTRDLFSAFGGVADMGGLAAGLPRSRMTQGGHRLLKLRRCRSFGVKLAVLKLRWLSCRVS